MFPSKTQEGKVEGMSEIDFLVMLSDIEEEIIYEKEIQNRTEGLDRR